MKYDFRKNCQWSFSEAEIESDPILSHVARHIGVREGVLGVNVDSDAEAFEKFFGISPDDAAELDEEICPPMYPSHYGYTSQGQDSYEILSERSW